MGLGNALLVDLPLKYQREFRRRLEQQILQEFGSQRFNCGNDLSESGFCPGNASVCVEGHSVLFITLNAKGVC